MWLIQMKQEKMVGDAVAVHEGLSEKSATIVYVMRMVYATPM